MIFGFRVEFQMTVWDMGFGGGAGKYKCSIWKMIRKSNFNRDAYIRSKSERSSETPMPVEVLPVASSLACSVPPKTNLIVLNS